MPGITEKLNPRLAQRFEFFAAPAENERIAALQSHDALALQARAR